MIVGLISEVSAERNALPAALVRGIEALLKMDAATIAAGRYEVEGEQLFVLIQDVDSRTFEESRPEAHRRFADVQIPLNTAERYGFSFMQPGLACTEDRLEANDVAFYERPARELFMDIDPGTYVVFLPNELHRPCLAIGGKTKFRKAVIKIHRDLLGL
ncbi:MAG: YhcH/YjgK/YiaL family protein [Propionivibrio sp.]